MRGSGMRRTGMRGRVRTWWRGMPLMRAFFCYAVACLVVSGTVALALMYVLMEAYNVGMYRQGEEVLEVDGGPYVFDAETGDLIPAVSIDMSDSLERTAFLGMRSGTGRASAPEGSDSSLEVIDAETERGIVYATLDLVRSDGSLTIYDWGSNYTEEAYAESDGNPYNPEPIDPDQLAAYDAEQHPLRVRVGDAIARVDDADEGLLVSNVAYYVAQSSVFNETPVLTALRIGAGLAPFAVLGIFSVLFFRRFYRRRLGGPLTVFCDCADRVARQDLDFTTPQVPGREFARLGEAFEKMRASLEESQRELWRTAEERRRLNAAFAHDLRTPVTVLSGTIEMAQMRAGRGEGVDSATLGTLSDQVARLGRYAQAMSGIARLEDREVVREDIGAGAFASSLRTHALELIGAKRPDAALGVDTSGVAPDAVLSADRSLVEEVLDNLLGNACDHAASRISLALVLDAPARTFALRVADDGPGFSPEALRRGCEAFYGEAKSAEHFGLGLSIVTTLARLHGGSVELGNAEGGGAVVTVAFDVAAAWAAR